MSHRWQDDYPGGSTEEGPGPLRSHSEKRSVSGEEARDAEPTAGIMRSTRREVILGLVGGLFGPALPSLAAEDARAPRSVLAGVAGLEKRVTCCETKIPLGELVAKVAADTGVALAAAPDVADEPVAVVVKELAARELLEELADLLDYRWSRRTDVVRRADSVSDERGPAFDSAGHGIRNTHYTTTTTFEIRQDLVSRQREETLRQSLLARVEQWFEDQLAICRELSGKSDEEMQRLWGEMEPRFERFLTLPRDEQWRQAHTMEGLRDGYIRMLWSPIERSLAGVAGGLSPEQWTALRAGGPLVFSSNPQRGELPLPPDVLRVFRSSSPSLSPPGRALFPTAPDFGEEQRQGEREMQGRWVQAEEYAVTFRFVPESPGWLAFLATATPVRGSKPVGEIRENPAFHILSHAEQFLPLAENDPQRRARLEQDPILAVRKPCPADPEPFADPLFPGQTRAIRLLPELLPDLARAYAVNFIADSYWPTVLIPNPPPLADPAPLFQILDRLSGNRSTWDRRGTLIRFRSRNWPQERPSDIPLRLVRRWFALCDRLGALPLEEYVALATTLSDRQIDALPNLCRSEVFPLQLRDLTDVAGARHLLRLYGRLSPDQQRTLGAQKPLAIAQLPPALRPLVLATLQQIPMRRPYPLLAMEQWTVGHLLLAAEPDVRVREAGGPAVPARPGTAPTAGRTALPAVVTRLPVTRLEFQIHYGPEEPASLSLVVAAYCGASGEDGIT